MLRFIQILGYSASLLAFVLQIPLVSFFSRVTGFWRLFVYDLFVALAYVGCVNIWRGFWGLYDLYFIPGSSIKNNYSKVYVH